MDETAEALGTSKPIPHRALAEPKRRPLLGNARLVQGDVLHQQLEGWAKEYGGKFRFAIPSREFMVVTDPEAISSVQGRAGGDQDAGKHAAGQLRHRGAVRVE